ncbi:MAG: VOC family protein [Alphaproteobacteria bacterium]|nr:VOC family protein [Alphaproteobacteria bacterium]HPF46330.1 VOC family protein [Emcibacteraceae bacterium]HRW28422.1 VOC family protein [Emcibacteraceae bacterium]
MQKITPFLWFDHQAEEAANFYVSIFKNSKINNISRYAKSAEAIAGKKAGDVMTASFELNGQKFTALNGGPHFTFSPAISFVIDCADQDEVDYYWEKLSDGGEPGQCGWLTDKFGVSWQVVPKILGELMSKADPEKAERVMAEMLKMTKMDIEKLKNA